ncbi:glycosyltransferase family 2 protein [Flavobacterium sp. 3HN19-14]|uniref:glycosyltransferase family 2 protein n=1 Tax=Flavobacterium sp. 3HN19-14 TaxID=3448133 RepID=UPI003EE0EA94
MENKPLISIIITFYNEENYLDRCLQSVKNQEFKEFEVVLINDGSTDDSRSIAEKYAEDFRCVKLITTQNSGHAEARNTGLKNCTAKFVTFFDADDELEPQMTAVFAEILQRENADLTICNFSMVSEDGKNADFPQWKNHITSIKKTKNLIDEMFFHGIAETVWARCSAHR